MSWHGRRGRRDATLLDLLACSGQNRLEMEGMRVLRQLHRLEDGGAGGERSSCWGEIWKGAGDPAGGERRAKAICSLPR